MMSLSNQLLLTFLNISCCGITVTALATFKPKLTPFKSEGRIELDCQGFYISIPNCPRCNQEHTHGIGGIHIDQYGIGETQRMPHCEGGQWDNPYSKYCFQETIIKFERTSHLIWSMENNDGTILPAEETVIEWNCPWTN